MKIERCPSCNKWNTKENDNCWNCGFSFIGSKSKKNELNLGVDSVNEDAKPIFCSECGTENPPEAKFCSECGMKLIKPDNQIKPEIKPNIQNKSENQQLDFETYRKMFVDINRKVGNSTKTFSSIAGSISKKTLNIENGINKINSEKDLIYEIFLDFESINPPESFITFHEIYISALKYYLKSLKSVTEGLNTNNDEQIKNAGVLMDKFKSEVDLANIEFNKGLKQESLITTKNNDITNSTDLVNWREKCPVCKSNNLTPNIQKGTLGLSSSNTLECSNCGAVFKEKGRKYKLSKSNDINNSIWKKYGQKLLTESEWTRIASGGVSDAEQEIINQKNQERDINEFLTNLQNGDINITTTDPCPVMLKKDEIPSIIMSNISLREPKAVRQTVGGYSGASIRVAKGVSIRTGGMKGRSESHEEIKIIDSGSLILTTKRLIFIGSKRTTNIDLRKIVAIEAYKDGIASQRENKQKTEYFIGTDKSSVSFNKAGKQTTIPITGVVLKSAIQGSIARLN